MHMLRKHLLRLGMQTHMMAHVNKIRFLRSQTFDRLQRFADALVRAVRLRTKGVHHQYIQSLQVTVFTAGSTQATVI